MISCDQTVQPSQRRSVRNVTQRRPLDAERRRAEVAEGEATSMLRLRKRESLSQNRATQFSAYNQKAKYTQWRALAESKHRSQALGSRLLFPQKLMSLRKGAKSRDSSITHPDCIP